METSRTLTDCKASHMDRHLRRLSKSIAAWKGGLRIKIFDAAFLVKEVLSIRWQCAGFVWELQGHLNRPGNSGGSPAWERGWNHGKEANWI